MNALLYEISLYYKVLQNLNKIEIRIKNIK